MIRVFAINLGSTSTKVAYAEDGVIVLRDTIRHTPDELEPFATVFDQRAFREATVLRYIEENGINLDKLDAIVSRGGQTEPIEGGVWAIDEAMLAQVESGEYGVHVCSVGCRIAFDIAAATHAVALTVDTPTTDEFLSLARYSGLPEITRASCFQALNHKAMARYYADSIGKAYEGLNLIVVMLGGGISVVAHDHGRMVDGPDALEGEGPFSNNRCCGVPSGQLVKMCYSGKYTYSEMMRHINGEAGLVGYLGTTDIMEIERRIAGGDERAEEVLDAMCYQTAKDIGAYATVLSGQVDAILLIGGMANSDFITSHIAERVEWIAPVVVMPGEREMERLCQSATDGLRGAEPIKEFSLYRGCASQD